MATPLPQPQPEPERLHLAEPLPVRDVIAEYVAGFLAEPWPLSPELRAQLAALLDGR